MKLDFGLVLPSLPFLAQGILVTLQYTIISITFGFILGIILAFMKVSHVRGFQWFANAYTSIFRGTPLLVQLTLFYFAIPQLTGYRISAFEAGVLTFSLNSGAYVSEIIRAGIKAVNKGQLEAALSLGIPYPTAMRDIILPQAIKNILPALINEMIDLLKESTLISVIGEADLLRRANIIAAEKYVYFEPLIMVGLIYYVMVMALSWTAKRFERRLQRSD
ncbi:MAG: amino acid ABC transporter permease [Alphaproteobacteria bacterium]|jgi:His/Glu/Gln/Arg/opine family amino acid ABC transporter permease subunit|nr:amino acid ABC transporter permease [Alphaproteobacteria bacterium]MBT5653998.1 amino acid ABC transporter permease [Alphaproteobacteria bacterium]